MTTTHEPDVRWPAERRDRHPDLTASAFHESGHAVAAIRSGLVVRGVDVVYTPDRFGAIDYEHEHAPREIKALCLLAAGAAERRHTGSHRAHDAADVDAVRTLFKGTALDPDVPYEKRPPDADSDRQRIVDEWYAKAESFVDDEWMWISRVARALERCTRLTGAEVKALCFHPVVHLDPPPTGDEDASRAVLPTPTRAPDPVVTKTAAADPPAIHTPHPPPSWDELITTHGNRQMTFKETAEIVDVLRDAWKQMNSKNTERDAHLDALEHKNAALEHKIAALEAAKYLKDAGIWRHGAVYALGDVMQHDGSAWVCTRSHVAAASVDHASFRLWVKRGRDGRDVKDATQAAR